MAKLIYFTPTSLDGYIADETANPDWSAPDEEGFAFISDLLRPIGMYLYGRKMYETMAIWETPDVIAGRTPAMLDFARIWGSQKSGKFRAAAAATRSGGRTAMNFSTSGLTGN
jgi:hypothetical protein